MARAEALLDEAGATVALLSELGLAPKEVGPKAEEAGLGAAVVKASVVLRALAESNLRGEPFSLRGASDQSRQKPEGLDRKLEELVRAAVRDDAGRRAADRLRAAAAR